MRILHSLQLTVTGFLFTFGTVLKPGTVNIPHHIVRREKYPSIFLHATKDKICTLLGGRTMKKSAVFCFSAVFLIMALVNRPSAFAAEITDSMKAAGEVSVLAAIQPGNGDPVGDRGEIIYVDDDNLMGPWDGSELFPFQNIQDGIDAASDEDTVRVRAGTYMENIDFIGKAITVVSEDGPRHTVIDGNMSERVVYFATGEGPDSVLEGFKVFNGRGGIYCNGSSPVIRENTIAGNIAGDGGGIYCLGSSPEIRGNTIHGNWVSDYGGGIHCDASSPALIIDNEIHDNLAADYGMGGGIECSAPGTTIEGNLIYDNQSYHYGGGISCSCTHIKNNIIYNNSASWGGGVSCRQTTLTNNLIYGNSLDGIYCSGLGSGSKSVTIINCIISGNTSDLGAGIVTGMGCILNVVNTIVWGNISNLNGQIHVGFVLWPSTLSISYSCVEGGESGVTTIPDSVVNYDTGSMIEGDPVFADPANADYHLSWLSPCINRGDDTMAPPDDLDGDPRPFMGTVDMGSYEYSDTHSLAAGSFSLSRSAGGQVPFTLEAGISEAGKWYLIVGSLSGTVPGLELPGGQAILPINYDNFSDIVLNRLNGSVFTDFLSTLDGTGSGSALMSIPAAQLPSGWVGKTMSFAYTVDTFDRVSNPVRIELLP